MLTTTTASASASSSSTAPASLTSREATAMPASTSSSTFSQLWSSSEPPPSNCSATPASLAASTSATTSAASSVLPLHDPHGFHYRQRRKGRKKKDMAVSSALSSTSYRLPILPLPSRSTTPTASTSTSSTFATDILPPRRPGRPSKRARQTPSTSSLNQNRYLPSSSRQLTVIAPSSSAPPLHRDANIKRSSNDHLTTAPAVEFNLDQLFHNPDRAPDAVINRRGNPIRIPTTTSTPPSKSSAIAVKTNNHESDTPMDLDLAPAAEPSPRPDAILSSSSHAKRSSSPSVDKDARNKRLKLDGSSAVTAGMNLRTSTPPSPIPESASCSSSSSRQHHDNMVIDVANSSCHHRHDDIFTSVIHPSPSLTSVDLSGSMSDLDNPTDTAMTAAPSPPSSEFSPTNTRASSHDITVVTLPPPILSVSKERSMTLLEFAGLATNDLPSLDLVHQRPPLAPVRCSKPLRPVSGVLQHQYHATKPPLLGSRLMALTHAQMTALMLGVVERFGVPEEGIVGMLPGLDIAAVEKDLNDALQAIYRVLTPTRSGTHAQDMPNSVSVTSTSTLPAIPTHLLHPLDNSQFRRASPQLAHFRATVLRHSQTLVNAAMHRDLLTLFFPLAMQYIDRVPTFEDPRRNRGVMGVYKRIAGHAKWAVGRCVEEILARGQGGRRGSSASETSNASLNSGFSVETVLEVERKEVRWNVEEVVGVLEKTERIVKGCRWFWEVAEFRALVEAGESGRGRVLEEVEEGWDEVRIEEVEETVEKVEKVQKLVKGNEVLKVVDTLKEGKEGKEGFRGGWRYGGIEGSGKKTMRARINSAPGWIDARTF